jgi:hypothetical protein
VSARGLPVLAPGDEIRLGGKTCQVVALDGSSARLVDVTGAAAVMLIGHLMADPSFELVTSHRRLPPAVSGLEHLPDEVRASAQWWEQHLAEVVTGVPPDALPGTAPRPEYDLQRCSLRQRELAKARRADRGWPRGCAEHAAAAAAPLRAGGRLGLVDRRYAAARRGGGPGGRVDSRVVEAAQLAISEQAGRSTGTVGALRRRVEQLLAETTETGDRPGVAARAHLLPAGRAPVGGQAHRLGAHPPVAGQAAGGAVWHVHRRSTYKIASTIRRSGQIRGRPRRPGGEVAVDGTAWTPTLGRCPAPAGSRRPGPRACPER